MAIRGLVIAFVLLLGSRPASAVPQLQCGSAEEYRGMLKSLEERSADAATPFPALAAEIPERCEFILAGRAFHFSTSQIKWSLRALATEKDVAIRKVALRRLQADLRRRAASIDTYQEAPDSTLRPKLQRIFQQREFRNVGRQDASAALKEWVLQQLVRLLSHIVRDPSQVLLAAKIVIWTVCIAVGLLLLRALYRWIARASPAAASREIIPFAPSAKSWRDWMGEARVAAQRGDLRDAIHLAYWAAISRLESAGAWHPDRARTPREYLQLIAQGNPARPVLAAITRDFEVIWYGRRAPSASLWQSFLANVEQIGCR